MTKRRTAGIALGALLLAACATIPQNAPLPAEKLRSEGEFVSAGGYRLPTLDENDHSREILVLLSISGGGKRSAAFGYGVLKGLRDVSIPLHGKQRRLLDEIDMITAVSGGSFTATYYGLHRDKIFTDFEKDFLRRDIDAYIWGSYLLPWTIGTPTNERMVRIYDDLMFHGATYADLIRNGKPLVSIDATDVAYGYVFAFNQDYFDLICSDLSQMPIARAVAASNGFPILFKPITLTSHAERCAGRVPGWVRRGLQEKELTRGRELANAARRYLDKDATRYVHLLDGGISDNLAMRSMITSMLIVTNDEATLRQMDISAVRRIILISADGQSRESGDGAKKKELSRLGQVFDAVTGTQIDRYNFETLILANAQLEELRDSVKKLRCESHIGGDACDDVDYQFVHLSLENVADAAERQRLQHIPTRLTLDDEDIDRLIKAGETVVSESVELKAFRASVADALGDVAAIGY